MSSKIELPKTCSFCKRTFIAKTTFTRYCSHSCNRVHYKERKKQEKIEVATSRVVVPVGDHSVNQKDFLSIPEAAKLLGVSERTIFRLKAKKIIVPIKLGRRVVIGKSGLFKSLVYENIN